MNRLTDIQKVLIYLKLKYKYPWNISSIFEKDSSSRTGVITDNLFSARKWGNEQTDRPSAETSQECLPENLKKDSLYGTGDIQR